MKRIVIFGLIAGCLWTGEQLWLTTRQPEISTILAVSQINGGPNEARRLREFEALKDAATQATFVLTFLAAILCFDSIIRRHFGLVLRSIRYANRQRLGLVVSIGLLGLTSGCIKPHDTPEYVEIDTSETGFLIPLEGDGGSQAKFQSEDYLKQRKVAAKRVQITHRWSQEGRLPSSGRWRGIKHPSDQQELGFTEVLSISLTNRKRQRSIRVWGRRDRGIANRQ